MLRVWGFPYELAMLTARTGAMVAEAQTVIALRMLGAAGVWSVAPSENIRMVTEKQSAFLEAGGAAVTKALSGAAPTDVANAWLAPVRRTTRSNSRRLRKRGLKKS